MVPVPRDNRRIDGLHILGVGRVQPGVHRARRQQRALSSTGGGGTREREALMDSPADDVHRPAVDRFRAVPLQAPHPEASRLQRRVLEPSWARRDFGPGRATRSTASRCISSISAASITERPHLLSKHQGDKPRILLSERPELARICREYLRRSRGAPASGHDRNCGYGWRTLPNGCQWIGASGGSTGRRSWPMSATAIPSRPTRTRPTPSIVRRVAERAVADAGRAESRATSTRSTSIVQTCSSLPRHRR